MNRSAEAGRDSTASACPLCGYRSEDGFPVCTGCSLRRSCALVHCPNCGYQFAGPSRILEWISRWMHRWRDHG